MIDINVAPYPQSNWTPEQLVKEVLISSGSTCSTPNVSNVTVSPNTLASNNNRAWGYFNKGTTNFPFADGIILSTGFANNAANVSNTGTLSNAIGSGSDSDLVLATSPNGPLTDSSILEFDFVPTTTQIKFNYIFASEEYTSTFPCNYSDAFALLLRPTSGGPYVNMAILPGGAGPVSVTNIRPAIGSTCGAINEQYFAGYNTANIETNFNGRTTPLTAVATVVPGQEYHFKMVLADAGTFLTDTSYDSAVFLEGGSFDIGVQLLDPLGAQLPSDLYVCDNEPQVLNASVTISDATYQWFHDDIAIPNATTPSYTAVLPGVYKIEVWMPGNQCPGDASITIHGGTTPIANDYTLLLCATPDNTTFDLEAVKPIISTTPGAYFYFYEDQDDAIAQNSNYISNLLQYSSAGNQTLYVVVSDGGHCRKIIELKLEREETPTATLVSSSLRVCKGDTITLTASGGDTYEWVNFPGTGDTQTVTVNDSGDFSVYAIGEKGCKSLLPATVHVEVVPRPHTNLQGREICVGDSAILDPQMDPNLLYQWSTGETTPTITVTDFGVYGLTVDNGMCQESFTFQVIQTTLPFITAITYDNQTMNITASNPYHTTILEYSIDNGITWQESNIFENLENNKKYIIGVRLQGTHCTNFIETFTPHVDNVITPNSDGINDIIDLRGLTEFDGFEGSVVDRYGTLIHKFTKVTPIWDGLLFGKRLNTGTYWYNIKWTYPNGIKMSKSGWILLKQRD